MSTTRPTTGILLFAHGSTVAEANEGVHKLAAQLEQRGPYNYVKAAFLEIARPDLAQAVREAARAGLERVLVVPYFLTMGIHLQRDLPSLVAPLKQEFPDLKIAVTAALEGHPLLESIIMDRAREVLALQEAKE